jgi:N-acetyl-gamma-glutamyl-phosphate reductase
MKKVGIIGGSGYTGGELIRLILNILHWKLILYTVPLEQENPVSSAHPDVLGRTGLAFYWNCPARG